MKKNLVLIGMMASGKSTLARMVSQALDIKLVDSDKLVEKKTNLKIYDIFKTKGENFFRNIEEKIVLNYIKSSKKSIIAIGGGAFLNDKIRKEIENKCISIWLKWSNKILITRIKNGKKRPKAHLLNDEELNTLINERSNTYSKADYIINCDKLTKDEIAYKIINIYEKK